MTEIPKEVAQPIEEDGLPQSIAELSLELEAPESNPYVISFVKYNEGMCEISVLNSNKARKAIETLKIVGTKIRSAADYQRNYIDRTPVRYEGEYKKLYKGLSPDVDLRELKLQQEARIFYFDIESEKTFYIVAITQNHLETHQVRR